MIKNFNKIELVVQELIKRRIKNRADLDSFKRKMAKKYKIACPTNIKLLKTYHKMAENKTVELSQNILNLLITRPIRSLSGIVNVSVLTKPYPCPGNVFIVPLNKEFLKVI